MTKLVPLHLVYDAEEDDEDQVAQAEQTRTIWINPDAITSMVELTTASIAKTEMQMIDAEEPLYLLEDPHGVLAACQKARSLNAA